MEEIILVDENDKEIGAEEKIKAHREGKLHRAFSILVFNPKGEMLLQKRSERKYHSGGLWTNACCSHPRFGETIEKAVHRRLKEEMGFDCRLKKIFSIKYKIKLDNNFSENEFDHVFIGKFKGDPEPDPDEVSGWKWIKMKRLEDDVKKNPGKYTEWFKKILKEYTNR
jgi:isopentenyl-diphosphate delta-isomerase